MKSLVAILMLAGGLGLTAGCTPSEAFCPNVGADAHGVCPIFGDDGGPPQVDMGMGTGGCASGYQQETNPDGDGHLVCVKIN
jgi:hypothetical protein